MDVQTDKKTFRSYLLFWAGQLVSLLGSSIAQFVLVWWITLETESTLFLSVAMLLGFAPIVILGPLAGVLVDRWNRKLLIGIVDMLQALTTVALISLFWSGYVAVWQVMLTITLRGIFQAFHTPAVFAIIPTMVPKDKLSRMNGVNYLLTSAIRLVGPVVAALLLEIWLISQILWIDAATFLLALVPLLMIGIPSVRKKEDRSSFRTQFGEGFTFIRNAKGMLVFIFVATAVNFLLSPLTTLLPYYVGFDHSGAAPDLAFVMAFIQGGMLAGGLLMSVVKEVKRKTVIIIVSIYILLLGYVLIALTPIGNFWFMAMSGLIFSFCIPMIDVLVQTILQTVVPVEMQGRVTSVTMSLAHAAQPGGMILAGTIAEFTSLSSLFLGCAASGVVIVTLSWIFTDIRYLEKMKEPHESTREVRAHHQERKGTEET